MSIKQIISLAFSCVILSCKGQVSTSSNQTIAIVQKICPNADVLEIEQKSDYTEIEFLCNNIAYEIGVDLQGNLLYTEKEITKSDLPYDVISKKLEKKYEGWKIDEFALIELSDTSFYKVELMKNGIEENAFFTLDGKWFKPKNYSIQEPWSIQELRSSTYYNSSAYDYLNPIRIIDLPETLREISGIAVKNQSTLFCVQDELGVVFSIDIEKQELTDMFRFTDVGDFEDIAIIGDTVFVLRSDGMIFSYSQKKFTGTIHQQIAQVNSLNIEGLCVDPKSKSLLLASKAATVGSSPYLRHVYTYIPFTQTKPAQFLEIDSRIISKFLKAKYPQFALDDVECNPSAITVHPKSGDVYILSALHRLVLIYSKGVLIDAYPLPGDMYYKPEGIAFLPDGNMVISSEGMKNGYVGGQIFVIKQVAL